MDERKPGVLGRIRAHPVLAAGGAAIALAGVVVVLVWFQPQALLFDRVVAEEFPTGASSGRSSDESVTTPDEDAADPDDGSDTTVDAPPEAAGDEAVADPVALAGGSFSSRSRYDVEGEATVYQLDDGSRVLRLEDFSSTNGPDLFVYLTSADEADGDPELDSDYVDLGVLKGNVGDQNYDIPDDVDLDEYDTAVIWCRRFTVGFGAADLAPLT